MWCYPQVPQKDSGWGVATALGRGVPQTGGAKGEPDRKRAPDVRRRTHDDLNSAHICGVTGDWVHQREECHPSGTACTERGRETSWASISGHAGTLCPPWEWTRR